MNSSALIRPSARSQKALGEAHLKFRLDPQTAAVFLMQHVQEVLILPSHRLTPMPNLPSYMLGLMNRRSRVLWVIDIAHLLGLSHLDIACRQYNLIVIRVGQLAFGLAVHQVEGMIWFHRETIQSPLGHITASLVPYIQGCILQEKEVVLVLDAAAIARSFKLQQA